MREKQKDINDVFQVFYLLVAIKLLKNVKNES